MPALALNSQRYNVCIDSKQLVLQCLHWLLTVSATMPALLKTISVTMPALTVNSQCYNAFIVSNLSVLQRLHWL